MDVDEDADWPEGSAECIALEEAVHCSICRDYFDTPLSLHCGHSFCSQCIRSNIQYQERQSGKAYCPQCRELTDSRQVYANHQLREVVMHFIQARKHFLAAMTHASNPEAAAPQIAPQRRKRKAPEVSNRNHRPQAKGKQSVEASEEVIQLDSTSDHEEVGRGTERQLRRRSGPVDYFPDQGQDSDEEPQQGDSQDSDAEPIEDSDASSLGDDLEYESPEKGNKRRSPSEGPSSGKKQKQKKNGQNGLPHNWNFCPICNGSFPSAILNDHLDKCLRGNKDSGGEKQPAGKSRLAVPPKLLLSLEKEKALRDRLKKYGLSVKGSRKELEQRYTRFRVEVQSALDRNEAGISYASIAKRITGREVSEAQAGGMPLMRSAQPAKRPADGQGSEFGDLIRATKARDSGRLGSSSAPAVDVSDTNGEALAAGEDCEVSSQPKLSDKPQISLQAAPNSMPAGGFRRPARVQ